MYMYVYFLFPTIVQSYMEISVIRNVYSRCFINGNGDISRSIEHYIFLILGILKGGDSRNYIKFKT